MCIYHDSSIYCNRSSGLCVRVCKVTPVHNAYHENDYNTFTSQGRTAPPRNLCKASANATIISMLWTDRL